MQKILSLILIIILAGCSTKPIKVREKKDPRDVRVALVLGGGGIRAIAHVGVIEELEKYNIPIDLVVGTSGGSVIGALYAGTLDAEKVKQIALTFKRNSIITVSLKNVWDGTNSLKGSFKGEIGEKFLEEHLGVKYFHELKIPFVAVATDILSGKTVALDKGRFAKAVRASYSIPGLFSPVKEKDMLLVDGGVTAPLPVEIARKYNPDVIIAVDVKLPLEEEPVGNMIEVVHRCAKITHDELSELAGRHATFVIRPKLKGIGMFEENKNQDIYIAGQEAVRVQIKKIIKTLKEAK